MMKKTIWSLSILLFIGACQLSQKSTKSKEVVSYNGNIEPLVTSYCTTCHSGDAPAGKIDLTTYKSVRKQVEDGKLLHRINNSLDPMPPQGILSKEQRQLFDQWVEQDYVMGYAPSPYDSISYRFTPPNIEPVLVTNGGMKLLELIEGHWIGKMNIMGEKYPWFAFDYRAISASHVHGIFEGGTMGNLFTSFFIADFKGERTIMARNGGLLNGIYRTSYFILDKVELSSTRSYFRLVDAYGGKDIMWMELEFSGERLKFNSYTSRFGLEGKPKIHMQFDAKRHGIVGPVDASSKLGYPSNIAFHTFSEGMPKPEWRTKYTTITSASYIAQDSNLSLHQLGLKAQDPITIKDIPHLSKLTVNMKLPEKVRDHKVMLYLSTQPLVSNQGMIKKYDHVDAERFNSICSFPELVPGQSSFTFTYLHPGKYYVTAAADLNNDGFLTEGDLAFPSKLITVNPESQLTISLQKDFIEY